MYIVSKFQDYYDSAMGFGIDKSLVYKRMTEDGSIFLAPRMLSYATDEETHRLEHPTRTIKINMRYVPILFCGKYYEQIVAHVTVDYPNSMTPSTVSVLTGGSKKMVRLRIYTMLGLDDRTKDIKTRHIPRYLLDKPEYKQDMFREWARKKDWIPTHIEEGSPVLLIRHLTHEENAAFRVRTDLTPYRIVKNPVLRDLGFYQKRTPYEAFQDISMFLGGVMGTDARPMVQLTDKEVHQKHGFDKWSFRKMPEQS